MERDHVLTAIFNSLYNQLGRKPSHKEVFEYILGDEETRDRIWNSGTPRTEKKE